LVFQCCPGPPKASCLEGARLIFIYAGYIRRFPGATRQLIRGGIEIVRRELPLDGNFKWPIRHWLSEQESRMRSRAQSRERCWTVGIFAGMNETNCSV
jgi:hypothetical protein